MLLFQSLEPLARNSCVLGEESTGVISAGIIGAEAHHPFIECAENFMTKTLKILLQSLALSRKCLNLIPINQILSYVRQKFFTHSIATILKSSADKTLVPMLLEYTSGIIHGGIRLTSFSRKSVFIVSANKRLKRLALKNF